MSNRYSAEQFSLDIEKILAGNPVDPSEERSDTERLELDVVRKLMTADFSTESQVRERLKIKLMTPKNGKKENLMKIPVFQQTRARLVLAALVLVLLLIAVSPMGSTIAQTVIDIVQSWRLGENSLAVSVSGDFEAVPAEDGSTIVQPAPAEPVFVEEDGIIQEPVSLEAAREKLSFVLRTPTYIPDGYYFNGVAIGGSNQASVEYFSEAGIGFFGLLQTAVGGENGEVQVTFSSDTYVEEVTVNGKDGLWALNGEEGLLIWEAEGVNYQLSGLHTLDLALQIAESIQ